jgi:hypothetical protein
MRTCIVLESTKDSSFRNTTVVCDVQGLVSWHCIFKRETPRIARMTRGMESRVPRFSLVTKTLGPFHHQYYAAYPCLVHRIDPCILDPRRVEQVHLLNKDGRRLFASLFSRSSCWVGSILVSRTSTRRC